MRLHEPPGTRQWLAALSHVTAKRKTEGSPHTPRTTVPGITPSEPTGREDQPSPKRFRGTAAGCFVTVEWLASLLFASLITPVTYFWRRAVAFFCESFFSKRRRARRSCTMYVQRRGWLCEMYFKRAKRGVFARRSRWIAVGAQNRNFDTPRKKKKKKKRQ